MKKTLTGKLITAMICLSLFTTVFLCMPSVSLAYTQVVGIVSADAAKVRKEPSTASDVVVGLLKGSSVTVTDEVTDSAGALWYKVMVDSSTGYIRSDLMIKAASTGTSVTVTNSTSQVTQTEKLQPTTATPIAETKAYVNFESARIREGASTDHEIVGSALKNTSVTITGEAKANSGMLWYQIKFTNTAGREVVGFIRSDLLTIGDPPAETAAAEPAAEEESTEEENTENLEAEGENSEEGTPEQVITPEETPEPEIETKPDYEMVYAENNEGQNEWFLYDNIKGTRQSLANLMTAAEAGTLGSENESEQFSTQKIIIIVLAVIVAILAVTVTLMLFKIRDLYDDDYDEDDEDDDEDDDDEEDDEDEDDEEEEIPVRRKSSKQVKPMRTSIEKREQEPVIRRDSSKIRPISNDSAVMETPSSQPKRKAKNFLIDDDEFEFEFLNMDDRE